MRSAFLMLIAVIPVLAAPRHSVTVLLDFDQPHSEDSVKAMRAEAKQLLTGSGIDLDLRLRSEVPENAEFVNVLVFKMTGRCTMDPNPILLDERGPLAEAYETDGRILSFGAIHCDQIKALMKHSPKPGFFSRGAMLFGTALGRVLAHEAYHMLGDTGTHTKKGVTRAALSPADLSELGPLFDEDARDRIQRKLNR